MAKTTYTCRSCHISTVDEDERPDDVPNADDPASTEPEALDCEHPVVCEGCARALEQRFSRPTWATAWTLGDAMLASFGVLLRAIGEATDHEVREVFPNLSEAVAQPATYKLKRGDPELVEAFDRIGADACIMVPEWAEDEGGDGAFLIYGKSDKRPDRVGYLQGDSHLVLDNPGCVNGYEYAPDGTPLRP